MSPEQGESFFDIPDRFYGTFPRWKASDALDRRDSDEESSEFMLEPNKNNVGGSWIACFRPCFRCFCASNSLDELSDDKNNEFIEPRSPTNPMAMTGRTSNVETEQPKLNYSLEKGIPQASTTGLRRRARASPIAKPVYSLDFELRSTQSSPNKISSPVQTTVIPTEEVTSSTPIELKEPEKAIHSSEQVSTETTTEPLDDGDLQSRVTSSTAEVSREEIVSETEDTFEGLDVLPPLVIRANDPEDDFIDIGYEMGLSPLSDITEAGEHDDDAWQLLV